MADDTDTPAPAHDGEKPTPRRRAAPRKTAATDASKRRTTRAAKNEGVIAKAEGAAAKAATAAKDAVTSTAGAAVAAVKPRSSSRAKTNATPAKRASAKKADTKRTGKAASDKKSGGGWSTAAIAGGVAAAGAAVVGAVLTLRGSSGKNLGTEKKPIDISGSGDKGAGHPQTVHGSGGAHQPDGTNSSASFKAGIADENMIPDKK